MSDDALHTGAAAASLAETELPGVAEAPPTPGSGLTPPRGEGRGSRLISDVIVDLGFVTRE